MILAQNPEKPRNLFTNLQPSKLDPSLLGPFSISFFGAATATVNHFSPKSKKTSVCSISRCHRPQAEPELCSDTTVISRFGDISKTRQTPTRDGLGENLPDMSPLKRTISGGYLALSTLCLRVKYNTPSGIELYHLNKAI